MTKQSDSSRGECHLACTVVLHCLSFAASVHTRGLSSSSIPEPGSPIPPVNAAAMRIAVHRPARDPLLKRMNESQETRHDVVVRHDRADGNRIRQALIFGAALQTPSSTQRSCVSQLEKRTKCAS